MAMDRYELFLRSSAPLDEPALQAIAAAAAQSPTSLVLERYVADGQTRGVDLGAPLDQPRAAEALCKIAFALAAAHQLAVFDPQLGRPVTDGDREQIAQHFERTSAFDGAALLSVGPSPSTRRLSSSARLWLVIVLGGATLLILMRALSCSMV
jgi:hypothetical protein